ncbi:MAG: S8 family peptidase [Polaribacter sp.]
MEQFPHLKFTETVVGRARFGMNPSVAEQSAYNRSNRRQHSRTLRSKTSNLKKDWEEHILFRNSENLAVIDSEVQPIFLQINPALLANMQFDLEKFGIEIISEEEEGFIIGASLDNLQNLEQKIAGFKDTEYGSGKIADFWQIIEGSPEAWKPERILSPEFFAKWNEVQDTQEYNLEVSIAFDKPIGNEPDRTKQGGESRYAKYLEKQLLRDEQLMMRQNQFEDFISHYGGELTSGYIDLEDSFGCGIKLSGKGLKDLVVNYQFVFEVNEVEEIESNEGSVEEVLSFDFETISPEVGSPEVGVIDSGIQEEHKFIKDAINIRNSSSYLKSDSSTADKVLNGGHGTKVAGAMLYPEGISGIQSPYQLPFYVRNLRVLDESKKLQSTIPADLILKIVSENPECKIFNQSINTTVSCRLKHMSLWAATMDSLTFKNNILFINSAGNIGVQDIKYFLQSGLSYPEYLQRPECRIANPAQSSFSLVVGSVNHLEFDEQDWKTIGGKDEVSPYSRIGTGIWGTIKPDVVEYGGALKVSKNGLYQVSNKGTSIEHLRSTFNGGNAFGNDDIGTSLSAPKITHIVAQLKKLYPDENINILRALVVQGARLPNDFFLNPTKESIKYYGYGIPSLDRVTKNSENRITFYNTNNIQAEKGQIYTLKMPEKLRGQGDEYDILVEVTMAYTANVRRTRQKTKSYLSTWLEWECSKLGETTSVFKDRVLSVIDGKAINGYEDSEGILPWKLRTRSNWGEVDEINRNNSTVQKDWAIIKSYDLPEEISFAVLAHKGWDRKKEPIPYALTVSIEILGADIPIYNEIRLENEIEIETQT